MAHLELARLADIQNQSLGSHGVLPMSHRRVTPHDVGGDHAGDVDRVFGGAELGSVAQLGLLQIEDGEASLDGHGDHIYPFLNSFLADGLGAQNPAVFDGEDQLDSDRPGAGVVVGMVAWVEVYLLILRWLAADPPALQVLLAGARGGDSDVESPADGGPLDSAEPGVASHDNVRSDPTLAIGRPSQWDEAPVTGHKVADFDRVTHSPDVLVAGAHLVVDAYAAQLPNLQAGLLGQLGLWPYAHGQEHHLATEAGAGLGDDRDGMTVGILFEPVHAVTQLK